MKIRIAEKAHTFQITLPTGLLFSRFVLRLMLKSISINGKKVPGLTPETADRLALELKHIKKKHGTWTLVEVQSADGEQVTITL